MSYQKAGKYACFEFERRFLLQELPAALQGSQDYKLIEDTYFHGTQLRRRTVRSLDGSVERKLTQKYVPENSDPARTVITNMYLTEQGAAIFDHLSGLEVKKCRFKRQAMGHTFSIDVFTTPPNLILAEIEFESEEEMRKFILPFADWQEVTNQSEFTGGQLALRAGM